MDYSDGLGIYRGRHQSLHSTRDLSPHDAAAISISAGDGLPERCCRNTVRCRFIVQANTQSSSLGYHTFADCGVSCQCVYGFTSGWMEHPGMGAICQIAIAGCAHMAGVYQQKALVQYVRF